MRAFHAYRALRTICTARATGAGALPLGGAKASGPTPHPTSAGNAAGDTTPLAASLARRIRFGSPLTVAEYMRECLTHPQHGYYTGLQELGARGDFITAPEVSQVFGELVGVWAGSVASSQQLDCFRLIELGAGTGALLRDALRALNALGMTPVRVDIVDASPTLRAAQRRALAHCGVQAVWHSALGDALQAHEAAAIVVGQEFLDALPVHVLRGIREGPGVAWREVLVDAHETDAHALRWALARGATPASAAADRLLARWGAAGAREDDTLELALEALAVAERVGAHVADAGAGGALFIDYATADGDARVESLRAFRAHRQTGALEAPGRCDLTTDVNFGLVRNAVEDMKRSVRVHGAVSQRDLLLRLGIAHRFRRLACAVVDDDERDDRAKDDALLALQANYHSLVDRDQMGCRYAALAILPDSAAVPPGFE